jgi:para-nitrobenzyl esterase
MNKIGSKSQALLSRNLVIVGVLLLVSLSALSQPVRIETGLIEGVQDGGLTVYKSIPFAASPVGERRWRAPQAPVAWQGVRRADKFGPVCMQRGTSVPGAGEETVSEDCLTLNIWTPAKSRDEKLAVMVWIPGGGFTQESASMPLYWGDRLARRGVIIITINYRVGLLGFFAHPELTRESGNHSSGNYGLLDQIAALAWVQRNVAVFGGDPHRVTIWGQSAGSMSVNMLMASPLARGLFQRAVGESGGFFIPPAVTGSAATWFLTGAEEQGVKLASDVGATSLAALRKLEPEQFLKDGSGTMHPIIDGYVLPQETFATFAAGRQNDVPLLIGSNADEGKIFITGKDVKLATFGEDIGKALGGDVVRELADADLKIYPAANDREARESRAEFERDLRFGWDMWTWARMQAKTGQAKVFYYYFAHLPPYPPGNPFADWGAGHWAELRYVFDHLSQEPWMWSDSDREVADSMATYWTNFAKTGDPNGNHLPVWPNFTIGTERVLHFDDTITAGGVQNLPGLRFLDNRFATFRSASPTLLK